MEYITAHKREGWGNPYIKELGIDIKVSIDRKITEEEEKEFYRIGSAIQNMLVKNSMLMSPAYQQRMKTEREELLALFGEEKIYVMEVPNGYHHDIPDPWFKVYTKKGPITIGWRKRVINIDWTDSDIKENGNKLFPDENVTKSDAYEQTKYIHAWGLEKAQEYINKLLS